MSGIEPNASPLTEEFQKMLNAQTEAEFECLLKGNASPSKVTLVVTDGKMTLRVDASTEVEKAKFLKDYAAIPHQAGVAMANAYTLAMNAKVKAHNEKK